jgi:hypothetical protein
MQRNRPDSTCLSACREKRKRETAVSAISPCQLARALSRTERASDVVFVVLQRLLAGLAHCFEGRKVNLWHEHQLCACLAHAYKSIMPNICTTAIGIPAYTSSRARQQPAYRASSRISAHKIYFAQVHTTAYRRPAFASKTSRSFAVSRTST